MNPRDWPTEKKIASAIFMLIGAIVAVPIGWAIVGGETSFDYWVWPWWLDNRMRMARWGFIPWVLIGAVVSGALVYAAALFKHKK